MPRASPPCWTALLHHADVTVIEGDKLPGSGKRTGSGGTPEEKMKHILTRFPTPYVSKVLTLYLELPETPLRTTLYDQQRAAELQLRGVSLDLIEAALLLGSLRRLLRSPGALPLSPIRSLAYFQPVIDELLAMPLSRTPTWDICEVR